MSRSFRCGSFFQLKQRPIVLPELLCYAGLSEGIEAEYEYHWNSYLIQLHRSHAAAGGTVFMQFSRQEEMTSDESGITLHRDLDCSPKLHVALNPENSSDINSDIQTAFHAVLRVLNHHKIEQFKVVLQSKLDAFIASGQFGKIFTIYLGRRTQEQEKEIACDIEQAILHARIYPQLQPPLMRATDCVARCDEEIADCKFVTFAQERKDAGMHVRIKRDLSLNSNAESSVGAQSTFLSETDSRRPSFSE